MLIFDDLSRKLYKIIDLTKKKRKIRFFLKIYIITLKIDSLPHIKSIVYFKNFTKYIK